MCTNISLTSIFGISSNNLEYPIIDKFQWVVHNYDKYILTTKSHNHFDFKVSYDKEVTTGLHPFNKLITIINSTSKLENLNALQLFLLLDLSNLFLISTILQNMKQNRDDT